MKGYILVDMPDKCCNCRMGFVNECYDQFECYFKPGVKIKPDIEGRPDWCPIRPQPEKFEAGREMWDEFEDGVESGRNNLIDEMFGGEE